MDKHTKDGTDDSQAAFELGELSPDSLYQSGVQRFKAREYDQARACFERYIEQRPGDAAAYHLLARVCYQQDRQLDKAEEYLKKAVELDPASETRYLETLGVIYIYQGLYGKAEGLFTFALAKDDKRDKRHTTSLEFYLDLVKKKAREKADGPAGAEERYTGPPPFLATDMGRWHMQRRAGLFLLPSVLLHAIVLFLIFYLSTHELPFKEKYKDDFTYVEVGEEAQPESEARPVEGEQAAARQPGERRQEEVPAPVSARKGVEAAGMEKQSGPGSGPASLGSMGGAGEKQALGRKAGADIGAGGRSSEETLMAKAMPGEKGAGFRSSAPRMDAGEVDLVKKSLGDMAGGGKGGASAREAAVGGLSERGESSSAGGGEGIFMGGEKSGKGTKFGKKKTRGMGGESGRGELEAGAARSSGDKALSISRPAGSQKDAGAFGGEAVDMLARSLGIGGGEAGAPSLSGSGGGDTPRTVDRGEVATAGAGKGLGLGSASGGTRRGVGGGKSRGSLGGLGGMESGPIIKGRGGEPGVDMPDSTGGRRFLLADAVPLNRGLDMGPSGGGSGGLGGGGGKASAQGRAGRESPGGLDRKGTGAAIPGYSAGYGAAGGPGHGSGAGPGGAGGGYRAGSVSGKGRNLDALGSGGSGGGDEGEGFFAMAAKRVTGALGIGGWGKKGGGPDAGFSRGDDLSGLGSGGGGGGGRGGGSGGSGRGSGVRLGTGEKSGGGGYGSARAGEGTGGNGRSTLPGGKKMADGALGVPGGEGEERYATAGRGGTRPATTEKQSGVGGRLMAKNFLGPAVNITSPQSGRTQQLSQVVTGTVSDTRTNRATLLVNNDARVISVDQGRFESVISLRKGRNTITVMAFDLDGNVGKDSVTLDYAEPTEGAPVNIISPRDGQVFDVSEMSIISVKGTIGDQDIKRAKLILNGNPMDIVVNRGYFEQKVALVQEQTTILVEAVSGEGAVSRSELVTVGTTNVRPKDIMVILSWNKPHADLDLHVYGPLGGHTCYKSPNIYESKEAIPGGQLEQDAKGNFGPEVFTQEHADKGEYALKSNYYYSGGDGDANATVTVILYGDNPSRKSVRVFGPHLQVDTKTGEDTWEVARFKMPEGIFVED